MPLFTLDNFEDGQIAGSYIGDNNGSAFGITSSNAIRGDYSLVSPDTSPPFGSGCIYRSDYNIVRTISGNTIEIAYKPSASINGFRFGGTTSGDCYELGFGSYQVGSEYTYMNKYVAGVKTELGSQRIQQTAIYQIGIQWLQNGSIITNIHSGLWGDLRGTLNVVDNTYASGGFGFYNSNRLAQVVWDDVVGNLEEYDKARIMSRIEVNGVSYSDYRKLRLDRSVSDYSVSSNFIANFDTPYGRHATDFNVGDEIEIFADKGVLTRPYKKLFRGIIEEVKFYGEGTKQVLELSGRDYTLRLQDATVEPIVYSNSEISTIVKNIMDNNVPDITTNNVNVTPITLKRISFNHTSVYEALQELAELAGYTFYIDLDKDLHFEESQENSSGITLDNTNILSTTYDTTRKEMANSVWVYGDRQLTGFKEVNRLDGSAWGGAVGSVYTLLSQPHNTEISLLGSTLRGGVLDLVSDPGSAQYLVDFFDRQIVMVSGTLAGNNIPPSGGSILSNYDRETPIVKAGQDNASIVAYGKKVKIINDKSIKDPVTALDILKSELELSDPFKGMELEYKGWVDITPGNTVEVVLDDFNLNEPEVGILSVTYLFDKNRVENENIIKFKLNSKLLDLTDEIKNLKKRLGALEAQDIRDTDVITRLEQATGSFTVVGSYWELRENEINDTFILGHPTNGVLGQISPWVGSLYNSPKWVSGNIGAGYDKAISLGSPEYGVINTNDLINISSGACAFWIKPYVNYSGCIFHAGEPNASIVDFDSQYGVYLSKGSVVTAVWCDGADFDISASDTTIPVNSWTHVVSNWDTTNSRVRMYINGSLQITGDVFTNNNKSGWLGSSSIGMTVDNTYFLSGEIDDLRFYNKELSAGEIGSLFQKKDVRDSIIAHFKFDAGTGSVFYNSIGSGIASGLFLQPLLGDRTSGYSIITSGGYY